jgi:hypothetical protein
VPPNESDDKAIKMALDLLRGTATIPAQSQGGGS